MAYKIISELNNPENIYSEIWKALDGFPGTSNNIDKNPKLKTLLHFGIDLTEKAFLGELDPVIGRGKEINRAEEILLRRIKNNICLVGEPRGWKNSCSRRISTKNSFRRCTRIFKK